MWMTPRSSTYRWLALLLPLFALLAATCGPPPASPPATVRPPGLTASPPPSVRPAAVAATPSASPTAPGPSGWRHFTTADGLGSNDVLAIRATDISSTGIENACITYGSPLAHTVWVGSAGGGLSWWDGTTWQTVTHATPGVKLAADTIPALFIMPRGRILIGTSAGLSTHCPNKESLLWQFSPLVWQPPTSAVQAIAVVNNSHWYGLSDGVHGMWQGKEVFTFTPAQGLGAADVRALVGDALLPYSHVWAGTWGGGITLFDAASRPYRLRRTFTAATSGLGGDRVTSLAIDPRSPTDHRVLWVGFAADPGTGQPGGVSRYEFNMAHPTDGVWQTFLGDGNVLPAASVQAIAVDSSGDVWVGTTAGLVRRAAEGSAWTVYTAANTGGQLGADSVSAIGIAPDGTRWFGTRGGGVTALRGPPPPPLTITPTPTPAAQQFLPLLHRGDN